MNNLYKELEDVKWKWWNDKNSQYKQTSKWYKNLKKQVMDKLINKVGFEKAKLIDNDITYRLMKRMCS